MGDTAIEGADRGRRRLGAWHQLEPARWCGRRCERSMEVRMYVCSCLGRWSTLLTTRQYSNHARREATRCEGQAVGRGVWGGEICAGARGVPGEIWSGCGRGGRPMVRPMGAGAGAGQSSDGEIWRISGETATATAGPARRSSLGSSSLGPCEVTCLRPSLLPPHSPLARYKATTLLTASPASPSSSSPDTSPAFSTMAVGPAATSSASSGFQHLVDPNRKWYNNRRSVPLPLLHNAPT